MESMIEAFQVPGETRFCSAVQNDGFTSAFARDRAEYA